MHTERQELEFMRFKISKSVVTDNLIIQNDKGTVGIAVICTTNDNMHDRVAALLTAAPELLETLQLTITYLDDVGDFGVMRKRAMAVIEKATSLHCSDDKVQSATGNESHNAGITEFIASRFEKTV